jgi:Trypsin-like peptidase domain
MSADNRVDPEAATWISLVHASKGDDKPLGCGIVIDERRVLTCRHVVEDDSSGNSLEEIWVAFPNTDVLSSDTRLQVERTVLPIAPDTNMIAKDLAVLYLSEPVPDSVTPAPLRFPRPADLTTMRWWAFGFPKTDPMGRPGDGTVKSWAAHGWIRLETDDRSSLLARGFSGSGLWSPDHQAVVAVVAQADGEGRTGGAITLHQAVGLFPDEELNSLSAEAPGNSEVLPTKSPERQNSREPTVAAEATGSKCALMVWQKAGHVQRDWDGRLYGDTGQGEDVQLDADRMRWPIARWRLDGLKALIFITDGKVNRIREVYGVDEETTGDSSSLALNVSPPLTAEEITERLPTLPVKLNDEQPAAQGRLRKYLIFLRVARLAHPIGLAGADAVMLRSRTARADLRNAEQPHITASSGQTLEDST